MPRPTSGDADDARDAFDANAARARATGGVLVVDGIQIVANHHRSSSSLDAKDAPREITSDDVEGRLARAQSAPADAESGSTSARRRAGWFADALYRTFSGTAARGEADATTSDRSSDDLVMDDASRATPTAMSTACSSSSDEDEDEDEFVDTTPDAFVTHAAWFNPEQLTAEKRRWLRDQRAASSSADLDVMGKLSVSGTPASGVPEKLKTMEAFLVCGLEPSAEVRVVADSASAAREARSSGVADDVAITDPRKLRAYRGTAGETYKASVLFHYPGGEASPNFAVDEVAAFCFPHGVEPRLLERTPSMSKLQEIMCGTTYTDGDDQVFVFQVQTSDNTPMYGVCAYVTEVLHQPPPIVQHLRGAPAVDAYGAKDSPSREARPLKHRYIEVAPRCYCILSKVPFFETHYEVLSHVLGMERVERIKQNMHDLMPDDEGNDGDQWVRSPPSSSDGNEAMKILENYSQCRVPDLGDASGEFVPSVGVKPIRFRRPVPSERASSQLDTNIVGLPESARISPAEEAFHLQGWAVVSLCCSLSLENVISLLTAVLLEKQVVVFSNNLGELSAVSLALIPMLRPFGWQSLFLPILPQHMVDFLDAPVPFVCGVQHKTSDLRNRTNHLTRINVYKDDVKVQWEGKPLRLPRMKDLVRNLHPLHEAIVEASVNHKKRPVIDPSQEAINAVREFLNAWRAYLNSLVASIRYHSITDVNEGGEGKVTILLKDSFLATFQGQDRSFMRAFAETQMFSTYCDEVLARD